MVRKRRTIISKAFKALKFKLYNSLLLPTVGFAQAGQKEVQSTVLHIQALVRAGQSSPNISSYYLTLSKAKQRLSERKEF